MYILVLCHVRPWKFAMNHVADLLTKMGLTVIILLCAAGDIGDPGDVVQVGPFMWIAMISPIVVILLMILQRLYFLRFAQVKYFGKRAVFAERLHDIVKIVGAHSILELRSYAYSLDDNDI